jgi:glutathionylspermidine synthase
MRRIAITPRPNWKERLESTGLIFHSADGEPYWDESACYEFTSDEVDELERATNELHGMCTAAVERVIERNEFSRLKIPEGYERLIVDSWNADERSLYGRIDLAYDGVTPPKMLEYNADTPTAVLEAAVSQWFWLKDVFPEADQFNSIHEHLIARWKNLGITTPVHFSCLKETEEDFCNLEYLRDTAVQSGLTTQQIYVEDIGWNRDKVRFVDLAERPIDYLFKLYPWEWMLADRFAPMLTKGTMRVIEPVWKLVLSNKGILPILWEMFPSHQNLLRAYTDPTKLGGTYAMKPFYSREGANVVLRHGGAELAAEGDYGAEGYIFQELHLLPRFDDNFVVIGSWIIGEEAAGIGLREDKNPITKNTSRFVPHYFSQPK